MIGKIIVGILIIVGIAYVVDPSFIPEMFEFITKSFHYFTGV